MRLAEPHTSAAAHSRGMAAHQLYRAANKQGAIVWRMSSLAMSALSRFAQQQAMLLAALYRVSFRFQPISLARLASSPAEGERRLGCLRLASPALPVPQNVRLVALLSNAER